MSVMRKHLFDRVILGHGFCLRCVGEILEKTGWPQRGYSLSTWNFGMFTNKPQLSATIGDAPPKLGRYKESARKRPGQLHINRLKTFSPVAFLKTLFFNKQKKKKKKIALKMNHFIE